MLPTHFQGVVPNEIRQLGTGYFRFSTDEEARAKEMEDLSSLRENTIVQKERRDKLKDRRKAALELRLAKIKKRKGLAPDPTTPLESDAGGKDGGGSTKSAPGGDTDQQAVPTDSVDSFLAFYKDQSKAHEPGD